MAKKNNTHPLLPAAQAELDQKLQRCSRSAYHAEAYAVIELVARGMKMQAIRAVAQHSEVLEAVGFNRLEDFFESLGISARTGFNLKKIAEAFSDDELQLLQSMGFSQRGVLKLASLPPDAFPKLDETQDPAELRSMCEDLLADIERQKKAHIKDLKDLYKRIGENERDLTSLKERTATFERRYPEDDTHWIRANRQLHSHFWDQCLEELRAFVLNDRAIQNDEAEEYMREFHDRIVGNLFDLNEHYKERTGGRSFVRER